MEAHRSDLIGRAGIAGTPEFGVRAVTGSGTLTATDSIVVANNGATINAPAGGTVQSCTDTLATYGATTALNTSNANSATFVIEGLNMWGNLSNG